MWVSPFARPSLSLHLQYVGVPFQPFPFVRWVSPFSSPFSLLFQYVGVPFQPPFSRPPFSLPFQPYVLPVVPVVRWRIEALGKILDFLENARRGFGAVGERNSRDQHITGWPQCLGGLPQSLVLSPAFCPVDDASNGIVNPLFRPL